jgi:hypothetical protein
MDKQAKRQPAVYTILASFGFSISLKLPLMIASKQASRTKEKSSPELI